MNNNTRWLLGFAALGMIVSLMRLAPGAPVSDNVADFATGFATAAMIGVALTWNRRK